MHVLCREHDSVLRNLQGRYKCGRKNYDKQMSNGARRGQFEILTRLILNETSRPTSHVRQNKMSHSPDRLKPRCLNHSQVMQSSSG
jgi:hypothetical protein